MKTYRTHTTHFDNVDLMAADLLTGYQAAESEHTLALLICDSQIDSQLLLDRLKARIDCPILGGTTLIIPSASHEDEIGASLTLFHKEGLHYATALTPPLDAEHSVQQVEALYQQCLAQLQGEAKLLIPLLPLIPGFPTDDYLHHLFHLAGTIPVFGGVTTDDLDSTQALIFADGRAYSDRMMLIALGGDVKPALAVGSQLSIMAEYAPTITESEGNIVKRVDDMSLCDYMRSIGIKPEDRINGVDALVQYGPLPAQLRHKLEEDDGVAEIRCISYTNVQEGSAAFSSTLPVGTRISFGILQKDDVTESAQKCLSNLLDQVERNEADGYQYSLILAVPCVARYFAMLGGENLESVFINEHISQRYAFSSFYGFCEIAPTFGANGEIHNRSHNASIVICAL